jgi:hypothetical protein
MKKFLCRVLLLAAFVFFIGCPEGGTTILGSDNSSVLINSVWVGETPRSGDWLTITFRPEKKVTMSFSIDNTSNNWNYTFDDKNQGTITNPNGDWVPAPNGFTVSGYILTITNYGFHGGASREFKRVRQGDLTIDPVPFIPGSLADNLVGSVWAASTGAMNGLGWVSISFREKATIEPAKTNEENHNEFVAVISYAHDSTTAVWNYNYNNTTRQGGPFTDGLESDGSIAPFQPGIFTISENGQELVFTAWHGGITLKRYR